MKLQENRASFCSDNGKKFETCAISAMKTASRIAEKNGISDMTLDEINTDRSSKESLRHAVKILRFALRRALRYTGHNNKRKP